MKGLKFIGVRGLEFRRLGWFCRGSLGRFKVYRNLEFEE